MTSGLLVAFSFSVKAKYRCASGDVCTSSRFARAQEIKVVPLCLIWRRDVERNRRLFLKITFSSVISPTLLSLSIFSCHNALSFLMSFLFFCFFFLMLFSTIIHCVADSNGKDRVTLSTPLNCNTKQDPMHLHGMATL